MPSRLLDTVESAKPAMAEISFGSLARGRVLEFSHMVKTVEVLQNGLHILLQTPATFFHRGVHGEFSFLGELGIMHKWHVTSPRPPSLFFHAKRTMVLSPSNYISLFLAPVSFRGLPVARE